MPSPTLPIINEVDEAKCLDTEKKLWKWQKR